MAEGTNYLRARFVLPDKWDRGKSALGRAGEIRAIDLVVCAECLRQVEDRFVFSKQVVEFGH